MTPPRDLVVAGGGPAGAALALTLARAGRGVMLLERNAAPQDKVCGEFLSAGALAGLRSLGLDPAALGTVPVHRLLLAAGGRAVEADLPFAAAGLSRRAMDEALLARAHASGVELRRGVAVRGVAAGRGVLMVRTDGAEITAVRVALATGKHDLHGLPRAAPRRDPPWTGVKLHLLLPADALAGRIAVEVFRGGYGGLLAVEGGRASLCLAGRGRGFAAAARGWDALRALLAERAPTLAALTSGAEPCQARPLAVSGVPYGFLHRPGGGESPRLLRVGDQFAVIPSFCGDGVAIALNSGIAAGRALLAGGEAEALHRFLRRRLTPQFRIAGLLDAAVAHPALRGAVLRAAGSFPGLLGLAARLTRTPGGGAAPFR